MTRTMKRRLRRYAITTVIAVAPLAILCAYVANLLVPTEPLPKPVNFEYVPMASIDQSNETIGIADSDMYDPALTQADIIKRFDEMQILGVDTIRVLVPWGAIELVPPGTPFPFNVPPDWSRLDFIVEQAMSRDMGVLGILNGTPWWAGGVFSPGVAPPVDQFAAFARLAAERYAGQISAYEVWNEPNLLQTWLPAIDPAAYTDVLQAVWNAIKGPNGADPNALVVAGVLTAVVDSAFTMDARTFVEQMYANGAKGFFDALSFHPYQLTTKFSEGAYDPAVNPHEPWKADSPLEMLLAIRQTMIDNGDSALRIWATEYGLPTGGPNAVTPQQQADFIEDFLDAWDDLRDANGDEFTGPSFIYTLIDRMDGTEDGSFGLFYKDAAGNWVRKPAADVVEDAINNPGPGPGRRPGAGPGAGDRPGPRPARSANVPGPGGRVCQRDRSGDG